MEHQPAALGCSVGGRGQIHGHAPTFLWTVIRTPISLVSPTSSLSPHPLSHYSPSPPIPGNCPPLPAFSFHLLPYFLHAKARMIFSKHESDHVCPLLECQLQEGDDLPLIWSLLDVKSLVYSRCSINACLMKEWLTTEIMGGHPIAIPLPTSFGHSILVFSAPKHRLKTSTSFTARCTFVTTF